MAHKMFLTTPDLRVVAKVEVPASVAQVGEQPLRKRQGEASSASTGSKFVELLDKWSDFDQLGRSME